MEKHVDDNPSELAVASFLCSLLALIIALYGGSVLLCLLSAIGGIACAIVAKQRGGDERFQEVGLALSIVSLVIVVCKTILLFVVGSVLITFLSDFLVQFIEVMI